MRLALAISALALSGCHWWHSGDAPLPEPATDHGLSGAEASLDHLTDKRDSRVAAAIVVAKEHSDNKVAIGELSVAGAMLPDPSAGDLGFARTRAERGDDAFYAEQVKVSQQLAKAIVDANARYESEKARKQAEYVAALKDKEMALAAEQEARQADKWTYAGIGLVTIGVLAALFTPLKLQGLGVALAGLVVGAFPLLSRQAWFLPSIGAVLAVGTVGGVSYAVWLRKPASTGQPEASNGTSSKDTITDEPTQKP